MYCAKCGTKIIAKRKFCPQCGAEIQRKQSSKIRQVEKKSKMSKRKRLLKIIIAFFLIVVLSVICISVSFVFSAKEVEATVEEAIESFSKGDINEINKIVFGAGHEIEESFMDFESQNHEGGIIGFLFSKSKMSVRKVKKEMIELVILAPDMENVFQDMSQNSTNFTESDLVENIKDYADKAELKEYVINISYQKEGQTIVIDFQNEKFINAAMGGMINSYKQLYEDAIVEYQEGD